MEIVLHIYFAINLFIAGYNYNKDIRYESRLRTVFGAFICVFFGVLIAIIYYFLIFFAPILGWIYKEIKFQYRFYFTDYWDKVLLDDNYSERFRTKGEKLKRSEELVRTASKQLKRHNRQVQNKYGR